MSLKKCSLCSHCEVCSNTAANNYDGCGLFEKPRMRGEWKQVTARDGEYYCYHKCTNCGQTIESGFNNPPIFNYCPNCGADMRKKVKRNDTV